MYVKPAAVVTSIGMDQSLQYPIRLYKNLKDKREGQIKKRSNTVATSLGFGKTLENGPVRFHHTDKKEAAKRTSHSKSSVCALIPRGKLTLQRGIRQLCQTQKQRYFGRRKKIIIQDLNLSFQKNIPYEQGKSIPTCGGVCLNNRSSAVPCAHRLINII